MPIFLAHGQNLALLQSLPPDTLDWSMLCPQTMTPESSDFSVPSASTPRSRTKLIAKATTPPLWQESWVASIPVVGRFLTIAMNAARYGTTLEQNAEFIARDLGEAESAWVGKAVGVIDGRFDGTKDV